MKTLNELTKLYKENFNLQLVAEIDSIDRPTACLLKPTPKAKYSEFKQLFGYYFKNEERRLDYLNEDYNNRIKSLEAKVKYKEEQKALRAKELETVQVGDIFCYSWGWEQTNVNFYQVIEKVSKSTIIVKEIGYESVEELSWASEYVRPIKNGFLKNAKEEKVRLNGASFKRSFGSANRIENKNEKRYRSWYA